MIEWLQHAGAVLGTSSVYLLAVLLCVAGLVASAFSFSGTWFVLAASLLLQWIREAPFPGWGIAVVFVLAAAAVEVFDAVAGSYGVLKRGGSKAAGWAALGGGILGMILGGFIPLPVIGSLVGMMVGSFGLAFLVEHHRLKKKQPAASIAWGAVTSRVLVIITKIAVTLGMIIILWAGILLD